MIINKAEINRQVENITERIRENWRNEQISVNKLKLLGERIQWSREEKSMSKFEK